MEYPDFTVYDLCEGFNDYMSECEANLRAQGVTVTLDVEKQLATDILWDFGTIPDGMSTGRYKCAVINAVQKHFTMN